MATPPRLYERLLSLVADGRDREWIVGDLREEYARRAASDGERAATRWYRGQVLKAALPSLRRRLDREPSQDVRGGSGGARFDALRLDLRLVRRQLARTPLFTAGAVLTLGLGLGLATAIFSVVNGVLLRPLPYDDPARLVWVWTDLTSIGVPRANITGQQLPWLQERSAAFTDFALMRVRPAPLVGAAGEEPEQVSLTRTTANLFEMLGVAPALGRAFAEGEDGPAGTDVVVLSWGYWQRRFGGDPAAIGSVLRINDAPHTVIGVMPEDFRFVTHTSLGPVVASDLWATLRTDWENENTGSFSYSLLGRVRPDRRVEAGMAELHALGAEMQEEFGYSIEAGLRPVALVPDLVGSVRTALLVLQAAVLVLLVAVLAGQAALLLARADRRRRELTIVRALGAGTGDVVRLVLLESTLLSVAGGLLGLGTAALTLPRFLALVPDSMPRRGDIALDATVLLAAIAASLVIGLIAGLLPALRSARSGIGSALRTLSVPAGDGASRRTRRALVVAQIALSFVLVAGTALLLRSMLNLLALDPGFATRDVVTLELQFPTQRYDELSRSVAVIDALRERLLARPGVAAVGATSALPLSAAADQNSAFFVGSVQPQEAERPLVDSYSITPGYLEAMGIRLMAGRDFTSLDTEDSAATLIDASLAASHWPGEDAVGRTLLLGGDTLTVVGVFVQPRLYRVDEDGRGQVIIPFAAGGDSRLDVVVRTNGTAPELAASARAILRDIDPLLPLSNVSTIETHLARALSERRLALVLVGAFGAVALLLAVLGTYTLLASTVSQRSRELGVRLAIGARPGSIVSLVLRGALGVVLTGTAAGLVLALGATRALQGMLYGVTPADPLTLVSTALALGALGLIAAALPARRASRIDPARTLREE